MTGPRFSDLPRAIFRRLKHGDWRGLYTRASRTDPDRYSSETRAVLRRADAEVRSRQNETLGTAHVLLALLHAGGDEIERAVVQSGSCPARLVAAIEQRVPRGSVVWDPPEAIVSGESPARPRFVGMTRRVVEMTERASRLTKRRAAAQVTPSTLLEALLGDRNATGTRLLREAGVNVRKLRRSLASRKSLG